MAALKKWIILPACRVTASTPDAPSVNIGFSTPKEAIEAFIESAASSLYIAKEHIQIREKDIDGCAVAYAIHWSPTFKDWSFVTVPDLDDERRGQTFRQICTCVEGIAVEFSTPGYGGYTLVALANATGLQAPKTNVARSALEATKESEVLRRKIYQIYVEQIRDEIDRMVAEEHYTVTWAISQIAYIISPLIASRARVTRRDLQRDALRELPMFLVESNNERKAASLQDLHSAGNFWSIQSELLRSAETLVREAPSEITAGFLLKASKKDAVALPDGNLVCNLDASSLPLHVARLTFEVKRVNAVAKDRRLDLCWRPVEQHQLWFSSD